MKPAVAIVSVNKDKYSETFIRNQAALIPAEVHYFYGGYLPVFHNNGLPFVSFLKKENYFNRFLLKILNKVNADINKKAIIAYCNKNKIKAILAHYGPTGLSMIKISQKTNIPLFVYFHGYDVYRSKELKSYGKHYHKLFAQATGLFVVSQHMKQELMSMGAPEKKIIYNPCGANLKLFKPVDASANPPLLISVGRFDDTKNHLNTIKAFAIVYKKYPEARLTLVGSGKNLKACQNLVKKLMLNNVVNFTGALPHLEVATLLSGARAFVLHSVTSAKGDKEGAPVSIMEAAASGLPVISTRHTGIMDIIIENETGFLSQENDIETMANNMIRLVHNPLLAKEMGVKAANRIQTYFSLEKNVDVICKTMGI